MTGISTERPSSVTLHWINVVVVTMILMVVVAISIRSARQSKEADTLHALVFPPFLSKKIKCKLCHLRTTESREVHLLITLPNSLGRNRTTHQSRQDDTKENLIELVPQIDIRSKSEDRTFDEFRCVWNHRRALNITTLPYSEL
jgi:hypothetical protein